MLERYFWQAYLKTKYNTQQVFKLQACSLQMVNIYNEFRMCLKDMKNVRS
jgi:hypothetical protein